MYDSRINIKDYQKPKTDWVEVVCMGIMLTIPFAGLTLLWT